MSSNSTSRKPKYALVILVMLIFFIISFITNILNSILSDVKESFELSLLLAGLLPFSFFIAYGVMSIPAGFLVEKISEKKLLSVSFLIISLAALSFILFPDYVVFSISLFVMGCCMAVLQVIINPMLRAAGGEANFAFNSVLAQLVFGGASFLSPYLYMYLVNSPEDRDSFATFLTGLVPDDMPWVSLYVVFAIAALLFVFLILGMKTVSTVTTEDEKAGSLNSYKELLKNRYTYLFFFGIFCYVGVEQGIGNWISQFLSEYHELDPQTVGANTVSRFWAMLTVGCLLGLLLLKLLDSRIVLIGATLATIVSLIFALSGSSNISLLAFPIAGFFISVMWSIIFSLGLNSVSKFHGSLSGILCTGIAGGAIMPLIVGFIGDLSGLKSGMFFLIIPLCFILSIGFWAKPLINNQTFNFKKKD